MYPMQAAQLANAGQSEYKLLRQKTTQEVEEVFMV